MARIVEQFQNGDRTVVMGISKSLADEVYDALKKINVQLAIAFWEEYKYFCYTGRTMSR